MIETVWEKAAQTKKPVLLYGTGNGADKIMDELTRLGVNVSGVFASDSFVRKRTFRGFPVLSYSEAKKQFGDFLVLVAFGTNRPDVMRNILSISSEQELYAVDVPVVGNEIFNAAFYQAHKDEIETVRRLLTDEESRRIYDAIIRFKLGGELPVLLSSQTDKEEAYKNLLRLNDDEIYMDLGAFNGDTVLEFVSHTRSYRKIYAVEPDERNFKKLCDNTAHLRHIERLRLCASDSTGETLFASRGGRSGTQQQNGFPVPCDTVDHILGDQDITYIKFDVEGMEASSIRGAEETIRTRKPKLLVSCYHRSEDIFSLALQIMSLRSDYRLAIRHFPYIPAWDTQFYFT